MSYQLFLTSTKIYFIFSYNINVWETFTTDASAHTDILPSIGAAAGDERSYGNILKLQSKNSPRGEQIHKTSGGLAVLKDGNACVEPRDAQIKGMKQFLLQVKVSNENP